MYPIRRGLSPGYKLFTIGPYSDLTSSSFLFWSLCPRHTGPKVCLNLLPQTLCTCCSLLPMMLIPYLPDTQVAHFLTSFRFLLKCCHIRVAFPNPPYVCSCTCAWAGISYPLYTPYFSFLHCIYLYLVHYLSGLPSLVKTISSVRVETLTCSQLYPQNLIKYQAHGKQ